MDYRQLIDAMTPAIYHSLKRAVETGKWPDGKALTRAQRSEALQAQDQQEFQPGLLLPLFSPPGAM
jgi:uncharacterized protein YeaC (DUF1315 family)